MLKVALNLAVLAGRHRPAGRLLADVAEPGPSLPAGHARLHTGRAGVVARAVDRQPAARCRMTRRTASPTTRPRPPWASRSSSMPASARTARSRAPPATRRSWPSPMACRARAASARRRAAPCPCSAPPTAPFLFWDGRKDSQWAQAPGAAGERRSSTAATAACTPMLIADHYRAEYEAIFGPLPDPRGHGAVPSIRRAGRRPQSRAASWDVHEPLRTAMRSPPST